MAQLWVINPTGGKPKKARLVMARKRKSRSSKGGFQRNPRRGRRYRRNPFGARPRARTMMTGFMDVLQTGAFGAVGGIAVDAVVKFLPAQAKTGAIGNAVKIGLAAGIGAAGAAMKQPWLTHAGAGAMSIAIYNLARPLAVQMGLGEMNESEELAAALADELIAPGGEPLADYEAPMLSGAAYEPPMLQGVGDYEYAG
jgi:hypothetical protein